MTLTENAVTCISVRPGRGTEWLKSAGKKEVGVFGAKVADFMDWLFDGIYHQQDAVMNADWTTENYIRLIVSWTELPTFDNSLLTKLVIGAHDLAMRVSVGAIAPRRLEILFHPRVREGGWSQRHPTIEEAIEYARSLYQ